MNSKDAAELWKISERRVRALCEGGRIPGAYLSGKTWIIPDNAEKPQHARPTERDLLNEIDTLKQRLDSFRPLTEGELKAILKNFTVEYTYNSNAIEGSTLSLRETELVIEGFTIGSKPLRDHLRAIGHKEAFDFVVGLVKEREPISERVIKEIHSIVLADMPQDKGVYRKWPVSLAGSTHIPPNPMLVPQKIEELLREYSLSSAHPVMRIAEFHLLFESIHPFIDGNGRTGRLIMNMELMKEGYPPIDIKFTDRKAYYRAFDNYHKTGRPTQMFKLIAKYLIGNQKRYLQAIGD